MKCPHCLESFHEDFETKRLEKDSEFDHYVKYCICPSCEKMIIFVLEEKNVNMGGLSRRFYKETLAKPKNISRNPIPKEVPEKYANDYLEACTILIDSPKASAALSRRVLQLLIREKAGIIKSNLAEEIDELITSRVLPSYLSESIDAIRNIGNFAAHPIKSTNTGEIVEVEPNEAEWQLDVLESLFDFYFVQPELLKLEREALNKKLTDAGKPAMK